MKIFIIAVLLILSCSKKIITVEEVPQKPVNDVMMTFPLEKPPQPPQVQMNKIKQCVIVYFKFDSDELQESEKWKISNIDQPVELTGGCCPIGTDDYNYTLGLRRAMVVKNFFEKSGINVKSYKSIGERELIETDREKYSLNRRCEIRF
jgi:peptidoglycan-associated lipoprotein